jgi:hypothetical protein
MPAEKEYVTIRGMIGDLIGSKIVDISQHDKEEYLSTGQGFVMLMLDNGATMRIPLRVGAPAVVVERG